MRMVGRLLASNRNDDKNKIKGVLVSGILFTDDVKDDIVTATSQWELWECEVMIRKIRRHYGDNPIGNDVSGLLIGGYLKDDMWHEHEECNEKFSYGDVMTVAYNGEDMGSKDR